MAKTVIALAVELADQAQAQAFAQIIAIASGAGIPVQVGVGAQVSGQAQEAATPAPAKPERKPLKACEDTFVRLVLDGKYVSFADIQTGKWLGTAGVRKALNARIKAAGAAWDADRKAWAFKSASAARKWAIAQADDAIKALTPEGTEPDASAFPDGDFALVTAQEWQERRDKAVARAERKGH